MLAEKRQLLCQTKSDHNFTNERFAWNKRRRRLETFVSASRHWYTGAKSCHRRKKCVFWSLLQIWDKA